MRIGQYVCMAIAVFGVILVVVGALVFRFALDPAIRKADGEYAGMTDNGWRAVGVLIAATGVVALLVAVLR